MFKIPHGVKLQETSQAGDPPPPKIFFPEQVPGGMVTMPRKEGEMVPWSKAVLPQQGAFKGWSVN
jgi:hypothetical protein